MTPQLQLALHTVEIVGFLAVSHWVAWHGSAVYMMPGPSTPERQHHSVRLVAWLVMWAIFAAQLL